MHRHHFAGGHNFNFRGAHSFGHYWNNVHGCQHHYSGGGLNSLGMFGIGSFALGQALRGFAGAFPGGMMSNMMQYGMPFGMQYGMPNFAFNSWGNQNGFFPVFMLSNFMSAQNQSSMAEFMKKFNATNATETESETSSKKISAYKPREYTYSREPKDVENSDINDASSKSKKSTKESSADDKLTSSANNKGFQPGRGPEKPSSAEAQSAVKTQTAKNSAIQGQAIAEEMAPCFIRTKSGAESVEFKTALKKVDADNVYYVMKSFKGVDGDGSYFDAIDKSSWAANSDKQNALKHIATQMAFAATEAGVDKADIDAFTEQFEAEIKNQYETSWLSGADVTKLKTLFADITKKYEAKTLNLTVSADATKTNADTANATEGRLGKKLTAKQQEQARLQGESISRQLYNIAVKYSGAVDEKEWNDVFYGKGGTASNPKADGITKDNVVTIMTARNVGSGKKESLVALIMNEITASNTNLSAGLKHLAKCLKEAAIADGADSETVEQLFNAIKKSVDGEYIGTWYRASQIDNVEPQFDALYNLAVQKSAEKATGIDKVEINKEAAMQNLTEAADEEHKQAKTEHDTARKDYSVWGWIGNGVRYAAGAETIGDVEDKLGAYGKAIENLNVAMKRSPEDFEREYKKTFGVKFDAKKLTTYQKELQNYNEAFALKTLGGAISDSLGKLGARDLLKAYDTEKFETKFAEFKASKNYKSLTFDSLRGAIQDKPFETVVEDKDGKQKTVPMFDDAAINDIMSNYAKEAGKDPAKLTEDEKKEYLLKFMLGSQASYQAEADALRRGRTEAEMEAEIDAARKSAFGTNDIVDHIKRFESTMRTVDMVATVAGEIALTVALSCIPGGQVAAGAIWAARAVRMASVANKLVKAAKVAKTVKTAVNATKIGRAAVQAGTFGTAAFIANDKSLLGNKDHGEALKHAAQMAAFGGAGSMIGEGSRILGQVAGKSAMTRGASTGLSKSAQLGTEILTNTSANAAAILGITRLSGEAQEVKDIATMTGLMLVMEIVTRGRAMVKGNKTTAIVPKGEPAKPNAPKGEPAGPYTPQNAATIIKKTVAEAEKAVQDLKVSLDNKIKEINALHSKLASATPEEVAKLNEAIKAGQELAKTMREDLRVARETLDKIKSERVANATAAEKGVKPADVKGPLPHNAKPISVRPELDKFKLDPKFKVTDGETFMKKVWDMMGDDVAMGPPWIQYNAPGAMSHCPWKMHLFSVADAEWQKMAELIIPYLKEKGVTHKTLFNSSINRLKGNQAGKAFTIYPASREEFAQIAKDLDYIIRNNGLGTSNANIIGDKALGTTGRIHYRYEWRSKNLEGQNYQREFYDGNRGANNHLANDMTIADDPFYNFDPSGAVRVAEPPRQLGFTAVETNVTTAEKNIIRNIIESDKPYGKLTQVDRDFLKSRGITDEAGLREYVTKSRNAQSAIEPAVGEVAKAKFRQIDNLDAENAFHVIFKDGTKYEQWTTLQKDAMKPYKINSQADWEACLAEHQQWQQAQLSAAAKQAEAVGVKPGKFRQINNLDAENAFHMIFKDGTKYEQWTTLQKDAMKPYKINSQADWEACLAEHQQWQQAQLSVAAKRTEAAAARSTVETAPTSQAAESIKEVNINATKPIKTVGVPREAVKSCNGLLKMKSPFAEWTPIEKNMMKKYYHITDQASWESFMVEHGYLAKTMETSAISAKRTETASTQPVKKAATVAAKEAISKKAVQEISALGDTFNPEAVKNILARDMGINPSLIELKADNFLGKCGDGSFDIISGIISYKSGINTVKSNNIRFAALLRHELEHVQQYAKLYKMLGADEFEQLLRFEVPDLPKNVLNREFYDKMAKKINTEGFNAAKFIEQLKKPNTSNLLQETKSSYQALQNQHIYASDPFEIDAYRVQRQVERAFGINSGIKVENSGKLLVAIDRKLNRIIERGKIEGTKNTLYDTISDTATLELNPEMKSFIEEVQSELKVNINEFKPDSLTPDQRNKLEQIALKYEKSIMSTAKKIHSEEEARDLYRAIMRKLRALEEQ